jgi:hypothetical protein
MRADALAGLLAVTVLALVAPHAAAQSSPGDWQFTLAPYAVAAAMASEANNLRRDLQDFAQALARPPDDVKVVIQ